MNTLSFFLPGWIAPQFSLPALDETQPPVDDSKDWSIEAARQETEERYETYCDQKYEDGYAGDWK